MPNEKEDLEAKDRYIDSLEAELKEKRSALAAAESKHAEEEERSHTWKKSAEYVGQELRKAEEEAVYATGRIKELSEETQRLRSRLSSLESRHAEEMRELALWREVGSFATDHRAYCACERCDMRKKLASLLKSKESPQ